jgi:hypothetical protein
MTEPTPPQPIEVEAIPLNKFDESVLDSFAKDIAAQATHMDDLAKQLITLNLAIPGLYASILKLVNGDDAVLNNPWLLFITFGAWLLALGLAFVSLFPERYDIESDNLTQIQHYFYRSARRKFWLVGTASLFSFFGICFAVFSLFLG